MNIAFNFLYRDAANCKNHGSIVVSNPVGHTDLQSIERRIRSALFSEEFFYPDHLQLPDLHFEDWDIELDHGWYEFDSLGFTIAAVNDSRSMDELAAQIAEYAQLPNLSTLGL